ncbi:hypothetical protein C8J56DRAFT_787446, partial [Mycena floridula]
TITHINGHVPTSKDIWRSIRGEAANNRVRNFIYLMVHGAQRIGAYWKHIPRCEDRQNCQFCGIEESMEHILLECKMPIQSTIWKLTKELLNLKGGDWPDISFGMLMGCGLIKIKSSPKTIDKGRTRLLQIVLTESMYQIWKLRCNVVVDGDKIQSERHIECAWSAAINSRLEEDRMLTNASRHQGNALSKDIVLETWSGTLKN